MPSKKDSSSRFDNNFIRKMEQSTERKKETLVVNELSKFSEQDERYSDRLISATVLYVLRFNKSAMENQ